MLGHNEYKDLKKISFRHMNFKVYEVSYLIFKQNDRDFI